MHDYLAVNRANWDERAPAHASSRDYAVASFVEDPAYISRVVRFDLPRLGDVSGLRGVHLQCHIGTDTVSLARLGASMTGLDFSAAAIEQARRLSRTTGAGVEFVQAEVYDAVKTLGEGRFDLVYTGIGALCWLPSIERWANVVAALLAPGGRLFLREGHPMLWSLDPTPDTRVLAVEHPYFEREQPNVWSEGGTYVDTDASFVHNTCYDWNHGLGELISALLARSLQLTGFCEHDSAPWDALPGHSERDPQTLEYRLAERPWRVAQTYTLQALKPA